MYYPSLKEARAMAALLKHGKQSAVTFDPDCPLFRGCPSPAPVARYHALSADPATLPDCLTVTARTGKPCSKTL